MGLGSRGLFWGRTEWGPLTPTAKAIDMFAQYGFQTEPSQNLSAQPMTNPWKRRWSKELYGVVWIYSPLLLVRETQVPRRNIRGLGGEVRNSGMSRAMEPSDTLG